MDTLDPEERLSGIRYMLQDLPDPDREQFASALVAMRFKPHYSQPEFDNMGIGERQVQCLPDKAVEYLAEDIVKIYALEASSHTESSLHTTLFLLGLFSSRSFANDCLIVNHEVDTLEPWAWNLLDSVFGEEDIEDAIRSLPIRLYPPKKQRGGNTGDLTNALIFLEGFLHLVLEDEHKENDPSPIAEIFLDTLNKDLLFPQKSRKITESDPSTIYFWLKEHEVVNTDLKWFWDTTPFGREPFTKTLYPYFKSLKIEDQTRFIHGYLSYVFQYWHEADNGPYQFHVLIPYYKTYVEHLKPDPPYILPDGDAETATWLFFGRMICEFSPDHEDRLSDAQWQAIKLAARSVIGRLPAHFRDHTSEDAVVLNEDLIREAVSVLHTHDNTFFNLKQLFRTLREAQFPLVLPELRYWVDRSRPNNDLPRHAIIPDRVAFIIRTLRRQQMVDPELLDLRNKLAEYCLERLKTRVERKSKGKMKGDLENNLSRTVDGFVSESELNEPSSIWRLAYIQAASAQRVNPKGRGHHTLLWVSQNDPCEEVRKAAKAASKPMRHGSPIPDGSSPRRPLFAAFWYLRRAHLDALGIEVDQDGANWTRMKEISYTRDE